MSRLKDLMEQLCPDGISYMSLGNIAKLTDGSHSSPKSVQHGYFMPSVKDMRDRGFDFSSCKQISKSDYINLVASGCKPRINDVLIAKDGSILKHAFAVHKELDIVVLSSIAIARPDNSVIDSDYLALCITSPTFKNEVARKYISKSGVPRIILKNFKRIQIPVPPIDVQQEVVRILTSFQELNATLNEELAAREKQLNYYQSSIFSSLDERFGSVPLKNLAEIGTGKHDTKDAMDDGNYIFYARGEEPLRLNQYDFDETAIITAGDGAGVGKVFHYAEGKYALHQRAYRICPNDNLLNPKFLYFYFRSAFYAYITRTAVSSSVKSIRRRMLDEFETPLPPLEIQLDIVSKLDAMQSLNGSIKAERDARQKQYEYYRDQIFNSFEKEA